MSQRILRFKIRVQKRNISVVVYVTAKQLDVEHRKCGGKGRICAFVTRGLRGAIRVCFARKMTGACTVAHEAVHIAFALTGDFKTKEIESEESLAIAVGQVNSALVQAFYKHGVYKHG